jgi:hypothetical protein
MRSRLKTCVCVCVCVFVCVCVCPLTKPKPPRGRIIRTSCMYVCVCVGVIVLYTIETYYSVKRDLLQCQKRPSCMYVCVCVGVIVLYTYTQSKARYFYIHVGFKHVVCMYRIHVVCMDRILRWFECFFFLHFVCMYRIHVVCMYRILRWFECFGDNLCQKILPCYYYIHKYTKHVITIHICIGI